MKTAPRYLLSSKSLAVMRVPGEGELTVSQREWAEKFSAILVAPVDQLDDSQRLVVRDAQLAREAAERQLEVVASERDRFRLKLEVLQDVVDTCGGEDGEEWNVAKLKELAEIAREIL